MYRSQYPDAPNLFASVRRPYRPHVSDEFKRTWLTSVIGITMVVVGTILQVYNEGRAVSTARALDEGQRKILVPETTDVVFEENNGKLVLISGPLIVEDSLNDALYGISIKAVKLKKLVQMYQWHETADSRDVPGAVHDGDHDGHHETSYSYAKEWFDQRIDSEAFENPMGHHNPEDWPYNSTVVMNQRVKIGGFLLGREVKSKFRDYTPFTSDSRPENQKIKMHAGLYFHAEDVWKPEVGDIRVHFSFAGKNGDLVTVVARQSGRELRPYQTEIGEELLFLHHGLRKPEEIFNYEHAQNRLETWILRMAGWFLMFLGYNCLSTLLDIIIDDTPQIRRLMVLGVTSLPFSFALSTSLFFIGIGWIVYRPILAATLLVIALAPFILALYRIHQRREQEWRRRL